MMAEVTIDTPVTTKVKCVPEDGHMRRNSTGNFDIQISGKRVLPHYLTASTGSCHDLCKYGNRHVSETMARSPFPKRFTATPDKIQHPHTSANSVPRKTKSAITPKVSPDFMSQTPNKCKVVREEVPTSAKKVTVSSKQVSSPGEGMYASAKHANDLKLKPLQRTASSLLARRHSEIVIPKNFEAFQTSSLGGSSSGRNNKIKTSNEMGKSEMSVKNGFMPETVFLSPSASSMKGVLSTKAPSLLASRRLSRRHSEIILPKDLGVLQMSSMGGSRSRRSSEIKTSKEMETSKLSKLGGSSCRRNSEIKTSKEKGTSKMRSLGGSSSKRNSEIKTSKQIGTSKMSSKIGLVPQTLPLSPKPSMLGLLSTKSGNIKDPKKVSRIKRLNGLGSKEITQPSDEIVPEKTLYIIEPNAENQTVGLVENGSVTNNSSPSSEDKGLIYGQNGVQAYPLSLSLNDNNLNCNLNNNNVTQFSSSSYLCSESTDTRHTGNETCSTQSSPTSLMSSASTLFSRESMHSDESGLVSEHDEAETENQKMDPIVEHKLGHTRVGIVSSEDGNSSPIWLKFRRGKVVNVHSEDISPRRLTFRKILGETENQNGNADTSGRSLRRSVSDVGINGTKTESVKVVLRHQVLEGRKGHQSLFNNVIEETASKLVQSRKSKVKALVGAFETIISLQPSPRK